MNAPRVETPNLNLVLESPEAVRTRIRGMSASGKAQLSPEWLALLDSATSADPWIHGFAMVRRADKAVVGSCGFKGPPTSAFSIREVRVVRAQTLAEENASTRVLAKGGFRRVGEVVDPEDGLMWRWEKRRAAA